MSKTIYEEALKESKDIGSFVGLKLDKVNNALEQALKQEKLLGHYKDLAEVRKEIHDLIVILKKPKDERLKILYTQEYVISKLIRGLEK